MFSWGHDERGSMDNQIATGKGRLIDVTEAANFLRIAPKTIYGLVSQRRIPFRKAGRRLLFLEAELLEWTRPPADRRDKYADFARRQ
jgi:excisionase family DNA binding protein